MTIVSIHRRDAFRTTGVSEYSDKIADHKPRIDDDREVAPVGDNHARFTELVLPHLGDAYSLARWITGNRADAEDVVQDSCLRAFRAIGGFAGVNARAWVLTIVRHTAYTWLGKNRPACLIPVEDVSALEEEQARHGTIPD